MDTSRVSFGEMVAAASGLVLFIVMWLPWYEVSAGLGISDNADAWQSFELIDVLLFLVVIVAVGAAAARAGGVALDDLPAPLGQIVAAAGALAVLLILYRIIDPPDAPEGIEVSREVGVFLGLLAAGGIAFGGYTAMKEPGLETGTRGRPPVA